MRIESKTTESAKDQQLGPLAPLVRAAEPLDELTVQERARIKHRLRATLLPGRRSPAGLRWSTALAALGLLLAGGVVFAAAGHFGLIPWPREAGPRVDSDGATGQARRRPARSVRPKSAPAVTPVGAVNQGGAPASEEIPAVVPPAIAPSPAAEPVLFPPASAPAPGAGPRLASLAHASPSPRAVRASHVAPVPASSARGATISGKGQAGLGEPPRSPRNEIPAVAPPPIAPPPAAEPALSPPSSGPVAAPEAGPRLAMAAPESPSPRAARGAHVTPATAPPSATMVAPPPDAQAMLGKAMRSLRNDRDPAGALDILIRHAGLFPQSPLASERSVLEVEALLALGRNDEALLRLDRMSLDNTPRSAERYVVRGELRARAKRWGEAGADFDRALARGRGTSPWQERALWGRAVTRTQAGDQSGARADLQLYLQIYPTGRFASEAAGLLAASR